MAVQAGVGLHARLAAEFSQIAAAAPCEVLVGRIGGAQVKANSPLRLLTLKIKQGEEITVSLNTDDNALAQSLFEKLSTALVDKQNQTMSTIYRGIGIGNTSVQAEAFRIAPRKSLPELAKTFPNVESEMVRYQEALAAFVRQLDAKSAQAQEQSVKEILYAQSVMAQDPELAEMVLQNVKEGWSAESAVQLGMQKFTQELLGASDEFGERVADLREIEYRIIQWLQGEVEEHQLPKTGEIIVVAEDLSPMETATFTDVVKGVVTEKGGPTSHTAIICRQLGIAAVVACTDAMKINNGTSLLVNPTLGTVEIDGTLNANEKPWWHQLPTQANPLAKVFANVGSVKDAQKVKSLNAQGVGLLRTEIFNDLISCLS